jgi:hypothetical protein
MNRLFPRVAIGLLALTTGIYVHSETIRIADYFWPEVEVVSVPPSPQPLDPLVEKSCDKIIEAWYAGTLSCPIPSYVQIKCLGVDEGRAHPLAQVIAHSPGH